MDLRHLRYIVARARNGSFSAAAHEFRVRQPIVSKRCLLLSCALVRAHHGGAAEQPLPRGQARHPLARAEERTFPHQS